MRVSGRETSNKNLPTVLLICEQESLIRSFVSKLINSGFCIVIVSGRYRELLKYFRNKEKVIVLSNIQAFKKNFERLDYLIYFQRNLRQFSFLEENFTKTNTSYTKQMENSANLIKCSLVPKGQRSTIGLSEEDCADFVKEPCDTKLPDLSKYQQGCTLKNTQLLTTSGNYLTEFEKGGLPQGDLPQLAKDIINAAGNIYKVPPALILATMVSEGSFEHPKDWIWTDENVKQWSKCGGKMPKCVEFGHPVTGSKGPVGWIDYWFYEESDKYYAGVQAVQDRSKENISNCNFMDAIFALAKSMQKTSGGTTYPYTTCWGHPLLMNGGPSTSCTWTEARVTTATRQYAGYCSEPPKNGSYPPQTKNNNHFDRAWTFYKTFQ